MIHGVLLLALILTIISVVYTYVSSENTIYVSDYAGYQNIAHNIVSSYRQSPLSAMRAIALSTLEEYNALFTIPLIPWMLIFGESRMAFELALGIMYLLPFTLILGALAIQMLPTRPGTVFWLTVAFALLMPIVWVPTLRGYPDTGAAFLIALAVWVYLRDTRLTRWWQIPVIGFLVVGALLFRRHFAYAGIAFFLTMALHVFGQICRSAAATAARRAA